MDLVRHRVLIYVLKKLPNGAYIALNRNYKPLGFPLREWVDYDQLTHLHLWLRISPKTAAKLSWEGSDDTEMIAFYNDGTIPFRNNKQNTEAYLRRLAHFACLKVCKPKKTNLTTLSNLSML